ncbi:DUF3168 domain-containing protein [Rhodobacterales bacterium HKCCE4037]|nr:DUF3168 domain-containing protein [Rhodobacterales bacterium HKCCE4037]
MSAADDLQKAIYDHLVADAAIHALVEDRIYDRMPSDGDYPCITFGPSQTVPEDMDCITARIETLQLDCWTQSQGRLGPARVLADAVKTSLHNRALDLATHALARLSVEQMRVFGDRDAVTAHGVVVLEAEIEERT